MNPAVVIVAVVLLAAIPINVYCAVVVFRYAWVRPRLPLLVLFSRLVLILALVSVIVGIAAFNGAVFLLTGIRLIPTPIPTLALVGTLIVVSLANVLVYLYLRSRRKVVR